MKKESNNDKGVVVFAYQNMGIIGLTSLIENGVKVIHVITHKDNPNHDVWWDSVAEFCKKKNICFSFIEDSSHEDVYNSIKDHVIQCIFSFHYRRIIPEKILELALHGGVNLHCSPLPKYKGKAPVNWQIINGESFTGVSLHYMTKEIDSGDIIDVKKTKILDSDDIMSVYNKLEQVAKNLLSHNIPLIIEGKNKRYSQNLNDSTYFGGRKPEDGRIDWNKSSKEILGHLSEISIIDFDHTDVVRHPLVSKIVKAYSDQNSKK